MAWCEQHDVTTFLALHGTNAAEKDRPEMRQAKKEQQRTGQPARVFAEFFTRRADLEPEPPGRGQSRTIPGKENPRYVSPPATRCLACAGALRATLLRTGEMRIASKNS